MSTSLQHSNRSNSYTPRHILKAKYCTHLRHSRFVKPLFCIFSIWNYTADIFDKSYLFKLYSQHFPKLMNIVNLLPISLLYKNTIE